MVEMGNVTLRMMSRVTPGTGVDQFHRVLIIVDHQANGVVPSATDVLTTESYLSQHNPANRLRFEYLYDKTYYLNASGEPGSAKNFVLTRNIRCNTMFNDGVAGTVADITTNSVYLMILGSEAAGATAGTVSYNAAVHFRDL